MGNPDIKPIGEYEYLFTWYGVEPKYFVIWVDDEEPTQEKWYEYGIENHGNCYTMIKDLYPRYAVHCHIYTGNYSSDFRGKNTLHINNNKNNYNDKKSDSYDNDGNNKKNNEKSEREKEMERESYLMKQQMAYMLRGMNQMKSAYTNAIKEMEKKAAEQKREYEEKERKKKEEHDQNVSNANSKISNIDYDILSNFNIKLNSKGIINMYITDKLLNVNNMIPKQAIRQFLDYKIKATSAKILNNMIVESKHFNIILIGKTGVGKSTLINAILKLEKNQKAEEGFGLSTTKKFKEYTSNKRPGLRLIDSRGIEIGSHNIVEVIKSVTQEIEDKAQNGDPDKFIHCIWYCIESNSSRVEKEEEEAMHELNAIYEEKKMPVIFVLTKSYNEEEYKKMEDYLNNFGIKDIIPVLAKNYIIKNAGKEITIPPKNLKRLIKASFEKCKNSGYPSFKKSLSERLLTDICINAEQIYNNNNIIISQMENSGKKKIIEFIKSYLYNIICEYIGKINNNEIYNNIQSNMQNLIQNMYNNDKIQELIEEYQTKFENRYQKEKSNVLSNYNISPNEVKHSINQSIYEEIENKVIFKILKILVNQILTEFNAGIMEFIKQEIKIRKKNNISIELPPDLIKKIQNISDKIYNNLGNISDDENEDEKDDEDKVRYNNNKKNNFNNKYGIKHEIKTENKLKNSGKKFNVKSLMDDDEDEKEDNNRKNYFKKHY